MYTDSIYYFSFFNANNCFIRALSFVARISREDKARGSVVRAFRPKDVCFRRLCNLRTKPREDEARGIQK